MTSKLTPILTRDQSKVARRELTLSQNQVIAQTGIQAYKLKQFEGRGLQIESACLQTLRDFYESQGIDFNQLDADATAGFESANTGAIARNIHASRPGFFISEAISQEQVDRVLDRMEESDSRVAELISTAYQSGLLGGVSEASEAALREVFGLLAESHMLFRFLQGKSLVAAAPTQPKTIGDMLSNWVKDSPAYGVFGLAGVEGETSEVGA